MGNYIKYLTISEDDKKRGFYIETAGKTKTQPNESYPPKEHPTTYYFKWEEGRVLPNYQIIYITEGSGIFENEYGVINIKEGSFIILFPGEWHRYKPNGSTGWSANYIGFNGDIAKHFIDVSGINKNNPVVDAGLKKNFIECFNKILDLVKSEYLGYQFIATGSLLRLIGLLSSSIQQADLSNDRISEAIEKIRFTIRENINKDLNMPELAEEFNLSYSYFRKMFKKYTGVSPKQYHLQLKVIKAKELLITTDKSVKEICFDLGFQSTSYFSRIFKQKQGVAPINYKENRAARAATV